MNFFKLMMSIVFVVASSGVNPRGGGGFAGGLAGGIIGGAVIAGVANNNSRDNRDARELAAVRNELAQDKIDRLQRENDNLKNDVRDLKRRFDEIQGAKQGPENQKRRY
jgi:gas vesicle protein